MSKYIIVKIELAPSKGYGKFKPFEDRKTRKASLHEALCRAIHERDPKAINWLFGYVVDIKGV